MNLTDLIKGLNARRAGSQWMAACPAHDDRNPSLAIREDEGTILLRCHAGCSQADVIAALEARGLWQVAHTTKPVKRILSIYGYTDEHGELLYEVVRFEPKDFRQRRPDGRGGWIWRKHPRQVLYHLPEVLESPIVFVVEGEKDVEALRDHGFVATTNAGGAKAAWLPQFTEALTGREVIIIPDNDAPGWDRAVVIARALLGKAAKILILDEIHGHGAKDISEWFAAGHSELELISILEGVPDAA